MAMAEAGNPEATWTVQVVAPTEIHMMVTVRYVFNSVVIKEDSCGKRKSCKITKQITAVTTAISSQETLQFPPPQL